MPLAPAITAPAPALGSGGVAVANNRADHRSGDCTGCRLSGDIDLARVVLTLFEVALILHWVNAIHVDDWASCTAGELHDRYGCKRGSHLDDSRDIEGRIAALKCLFTEP